MGYECNDNIAVITFDDGKANAIGHDFMDTMIDGLERATNDAQAVVVTGRKGLLSAGFDLQEIAKGREAARAVVSKGATMFFRLLAHPQPLVMACTGHAIAAGAFLLLTADNRVGTIGDFKIGLNETSIGSTFPVFGIQLGRTRLNPAYQTRAFVQSEVFSPDDAVKAGFLDQVVAADAVLETALELARNLAKLPTDVYAQNKLDLRRPAIEAIQDSL